MALRELCLATLRELDYARLEKRAAEQTMSSRKA